MTMVNIDDKLGEDIEKIVQEDNITYPNVRNFVNKVLREKIEAIKYGNDSETAK